jgi:hypothetical protein
VLAPPDAARAGLKVARCSDKKAVLEQTIDFPKGRMSKDAGVD